MADVMTDDQIAATEANMTAAGIPLTESVVVDYFGFEETHVVYLPDGKQFIEHKVLNEGQKRKYQNSVNRDVVIQRATGDAKMRMAPGDERHALLKVAICGWNVYRNGTPLPFTSRNLDDFLDLAPPKVIDVIEKEVRKANPWLMAEMTVEDIDKEIDSLKEMREKKLEEEAGKDSSARR
jgi:hypothetical protein